MGTDTRTKAGAARGLEYKATTVTDETGLIAADDRTGVVEAIVSVTGVQDDDGDTITPGAYAKTLKNRTPKGIFGHDWKVWASRTEQIEELAPGDARLAKYAKEMGKQWPAEAGGLYVRTRYNLNTDAGREAYENVKFFSETGECAWSIGYRVPPGKAFRTKSGGRRIEEVDLFEYSPVLFGAAGLAGTLSVKDGQAALAEAEPAEEQDELEPAEEIEPADRADEAQEDGEVDEQRDLDDEDPAEGDDEDAELAALHAAAESEIDWGEVEEAARSAPDEILEAAEPAEEQEEKRAFSPGRRREDAKTGKALPDGSYPVETVEDLKNAIKAFGRAKDKAKAKAHILKCARRLNRMDLIPGGWKQEKVAEEDLEVKAGTPGTADTPSDATAVQKLKHWYVRGEGAKRIRWGQPGDWSRCVHIASKHMTPEQARGFCQLRHRDALGVYAGQERKDVDPDELEHATHEPPTGPAGTYEELRDQLHEAATKALNFDDPYMIELLGTWPDRMIVNRYTLGAEQDTKSFEIPYRIDGDEVELGEPIPVEVTVDVDGDETGTGELFPYPAMVDDVTGALRAHAAAGIETKAGRVLSGVNATRLKTAVEQLIAVLSAAGIIVKTPDTDRDDIEVPREEDSTAPSTRSNPLPEGKALVDPALQARAYRIFADVHSR